MGLQETLNRARMAFAEEPCRKRQLVEDFGVMPEDAEDACLYDDFESIYGHVQGLVHRNAIDHGWWDGDRNPGEAIALMHSELSEALEAMREGGKLTTKMSEKAPAFSAVEEELADVVIRIMDFAEGHGLDIAGALLAKHEYNKGRPYRHGKRF